MKISCIASNANHERVHRDQYVLVIIFTHPLSNERKQGDKTDQAHKP